MFDPAFTITTPRLTISHFFPSNDTHCQLIFELYNAPATQASNAAALFPDLDAAKALVEKGAQGMKATGYGRYLVSLRPISPTDHEINIGMVGMSLGRFPDSPTIPDLGFGLLPEFHGNGYAVEAAAALVNYYKEERGVVAFSGFTSDHNVGGMKVFQRLGWNNRGVRDVRGVKEGEVYRCVVWTDGVGMEEEGLVRAMIGGSP
jgi:RimJ/RimL family protein N-acetyltransferase